MLYTQGVFSVDVDDFASSVAACSWQLSSDYSNSTLATVSSAFLLHGDAIKLTVLHF